MKEIVDIYAGSSPSMNPLGTLHPGLLGCITTLTVLNEVADLCAAKIDQDHSICL